MQFIILSSFSAFVNSFFQYFYKKVFLFCFSRSGEAKEGKKGALEGGFWYEKKFFKKNKKFLKKGLQFEKKCDIIGKVSSQGPLVKRSRR